MWTWRQHSVDLAGFVENFSGVILHRGAFVEMYSDRELASVHLDDGRRRPEQLRVVCEVFHSQSSRHDQQLHGHTFLQRRESEEGLKWVKHSAVCDSGFEHSRVSSPCFWAGRYETTVRRGCLCTRSFHEPRLWLSHCISGAGNPTRQNRDTEKTAETSK